MSKIKNKTCALNKIRASDSEEKVIRSLGNPSSIENMGTTKVLNYSNLKMKVSIGDEGTFNIRVVE